MGFWRIVLLLQGQGKEERRPLPYFTLDPNAIPLGIPRSV